MPCNCKGKSGHFKTKPASEGDSSLALPVARLLTLPHDRADSCAVLLHRPCDDHDDDDDVYYSKGRRPREDEEGEESYEKQRQWPDLVFCYNSPQF